MIEYLHDAGFQYAKVLCRIDDFVHHYPHCKEGYCIFLTIIRVKIGIIVTRIVL